MSNGREQGLEELPQRFDVWQADARRPAAVVRGGGQSARPWLSVAVSPTDDQVLALELSHEEPAAPELWALLLKAMREPAAGEPHRPTEVQFLGRRWADALRPALLAANVECAAVEALDGVDGVLEELAGQLLVHDQPGLLDMPGVAPEAVAAFFDAAALFFEQAPWEKVGERPIRVECARLDSGPWYAVLLGQGGVAHGLVLYDDLDTLRRIQGVGLTEQEGARRTSSLAVAFGGEGDLVEADAAALRAHG
jgi:hypothetical protein